MMKKILFSLMAAVVLIALSVLPAQAEDLSGEIDGEAVYSLYDASGALITMRGARIWEGDEYIAGDNAHYRVISVDDGNQTAVAEYLGQADAGAASQRAFAFMGAQAEGEKRIGMYSTHSDESYVPNDGDYSLEENAGIYDVGHALKDELEKYGITVVYSEETFLPHDAGAYRRSRATAEELIKDQPDALFDIHRDAIPVEHYETEIDGEETSKVRLFVGRNNPNADVNKAFAQKIKAAADEKYPGLIKDIFIGKGNYNQELYPQALLLEMGTHKIDKDLVITSTGYLADVINEVLYGGSAQAAAPGETGKGDDKNAAKGVVWIIVIAAIAAAVYALASTGRLGGMWNKLKRGASEMTGGMTGKKPDDRK